MIRISNITIKYGNNEVIKPSAISIHPNTLTLLFGKSGAGKSSILYQLGLFDTLQCEYLLHNKEVHHFNQKEMDSLRRTHFSFVFQEQVYLSQYNVRENIVVYGKIAGVEIQQEEIEKYLDIVGLAPTILQQSMDTLSGGERQRIAVVCALAKKANIIILDEPTSALDITNTKRIFELLKKLVTEYHKTIILVSHDMLAKEYSDCIYEIQSKKIVCVKNQAVGKEVASQVENKIEASFNRNYILAYCKAKKKSFLMIVSSLMFLLIGVLAVYETMTKGVIEQEKSITSLSNNQLFVVGDISTEWIDNVAEKYDVYPYIYMKIKIDQNYYAVHPYFSKKELEGKIDAIVSLDEDMGIYVSHSIAITNKSFLASIKELETTVYLGHEMVDEEIIECTVTIPFSGYLNTYVYSYYDVENIDFVYMPQSVIEELYASLDTDIQHIGYTVFTDSYAQIEELKEEIDSTNQMRYEDGFQSMTTIQESLKNMSIVEIVACAIGILVCFSQYIFVVYWLLQQRKEELALLYVNGISKRQITNILLSEKSLEILCSTIFVCIITVLYEQMFAFYASYTSVLLITFAALTILTQVLTVNYVKRLRIVQTFRK